SEDSMDSNVRNDPGGDVEIRGPDRPGVAEQLGKLRIRATLEVDALESSRSSIAARRGFSGADGAQTDGFLADEGILLGARDGFEKALGSRIRNACEGVEYLQAQVLGSAFVSLEQTRQRLCGSPDTQRTCRRDVGLRVRQHLHQAGKRARILDF